MIDARIVAELLSRYQPIEDGATMKSRELVLMLLECSPRPFSRSQFTPGHITCTGLVTSPDGKRVLLVHHGRLNRWLLPGGHVETDDCAIGDVARREVMEETNAVLAADAEPVLVGIDVHGIPGRASEPYHLHHDLIFRFRALSEEIRVSPESHAVAWLEVAEWERYAVPENVRRCWARIGQPAGITEL